MQWYYRYQRRAYDSGKKHSPEVEVQKNLLYYIFCCFSDCYAYLEANVLSLKFFDFCIRIITFNVYVYIIEYASFDVEILPMAYS